MASASSIINEKAINLFGVGVSLADIFKLLLTYWRPDGTLARQVKVSLQGALAANNAQMLCELLNTDGFTEAINQGITQVLAAKLQLMSGAMGQCNVNCSTGSIDVDLVQLLFDFAVSAFSVDGVDIAAASRELITQIVCCALTMGINAAVSRCNPLQVLGKIREKCRQVLAAGGPTGASTALATAQSAGYMQTPAQAEAKSRAKLKKQRRGLYQLALDDVNAGSWTPFWLTAAGTAAVSSIILYRRGKLPWLRRRR